MKVLGLCSHPIESAATRYRLSQYVRPLRGRGIFINVKPFISSKQFGRLYRSGSTFTKGVGMLPPLAERLSLAVRVNDYDLIFVQREAMLFGPAIFETLYQRVAKVPLVLDLDDATYIPYVSPTFGRIGSWLKFFSKTDKLIDRAAVVVCGNPMIADYVQSRGSDAVVIPTVVDTDLFRPDDSKENGLPVIGWIGTHSTFRFLERLFPVFETLARRRKFVLRIVGAGVDEVRIDGVVTDVRPWDLSREVDDFRSLDIGLYPIFADSAVSAEWIAGKSGFKAIQYLAAGVPFVMSPVGVCATIGRDGETHFNAEDERQWAEHLDSLLASRDLRIRMGARARAFSLAHYSLREQSDKMAQVLRRYAQ